MDPKDELLNDQPMETSVESQLEEVAAQPQSDNQNSELEAVQQENSSLKQKVMQLMADFENMRKRAETDKAKYALLGNMMLVSQIAEIGDDIQLSLNDANLEINHAKEMLKAVQDKLTAALQSSGLSQVAVNKGDKFDSATMEAITTIPVQEGFEANTVADVVSAGYKHNQTDEIVKTAKVVVFK